MFSAFYFGLVMFALNTILVLFMLICKQSLINYRFAVLVLTIAPFPPIIGQIHKTGNFLNAKLCSEHQTLCQSNHLTQLPLILPSKLLGIINRIEGQLYTMDYGSTSIFSNDTISSDI
jgi:hypothetical protein